MADYRKMAELLLAGASRRKIASICKCSSKTITKVQKYLDENKIRTKDVLDKKNTEELKKAISSRKKYLTKKARPDYDTVHVALVEGKSLITLWNDYKTHCEASKLKPISYPRFAELVKVYEREHRATEDCYIKAGDLVIVKWINRSVATVDSDGVAGKAYIFIMYFPVSQSVYLYGRQDKSAETTERLIAECFEEIGGNPKAMMTDNIRSFYSNKGVWCSQLVHLCSHYGIGIVPEETVSPMVLSEFEALTKVVEKTARENIYRSITDLNDFLREMQSSHGNENIKGHITRDGLFKDEVRFMRPVPQHRYEVFKEDIMTILYNLHISVDGTFYSVPYTAYMEDVFVTVRSYADRIEIYQKDVMIAKHRRTANRFCTEISHMPPPDIRETLSWNGKRIHEWAASIGPETTRVIDGIIDRHPIEQQCYNTCITILQLSNKYGAARLEEACGSIKDTAMSYAYRSIKKYLGVLQ